MGIFSEDISNRLNKRNQNALILMVGEPGSGKSVNSSSIAHDIDPTFDFDTLGLRIAKSPKEFLVATEAMKGGQMLVWDEAGVGLSSSEWWEQANVLVNYVLQTFRHENIGAIFTAPSMKDVDSKTRSRFHYILEVSKIDYRTKVATVRVHRRKQNQLTGKTFYPRLRRNYGNLTLILQELEVPLMPEEVLAKYESIAKPWKQNLKADIMAQLDEIGKAAGGLTDQEIVSKITGDDYADIARKSGKYGIKLDKDIVEFKYGIGAKRSVRIIKAAKRQLRDKVEEKKSAKLVNKPVN
jgi:KaiC/GvpD/RAD55 family RecA-like ATPase